ncbi:MAG: DEAD/DEAH box helicase [Gammaproteobacteria bacterium]|nr:DEAD/DEAH box helicase [Gammaproteobacteria bacterium]
MASSVGWLHVERSGAGGKRAALFETGIAGEPRQFAIVTTAGQRTDTGSQRRDIVNPLLKGSDGLALVFARAGDLTRPCAATLDVPVWLLPDPGAVGGTGRAPSWANRPTPAAETVMRELAVPQEEMVDRVVRAMSTAFDDRIVRAATELAGFAVSFALQLAETPAGNSADLASRLHQILCPSGAERSAPAVTDPGLLSWPAPLMPFQREGVRVLLDMARVLLADDMGLGKTIQTIATLRIRKSRGELGSVLVVAPSSVLDQWRRELAKWAPELTAIVVRGSASDRLWKWRAGTDVTLTSYGILRQDVWRAEVAGRHWDTVVADEAQRIKNRVETSDAVKRLRRSRSWALTGTPIENREDELASILEFVDHDGTVPLKRFGVSPELFERHRALQLRRRRQDVLRDLPPKLVSTRRIELMPRQRASYDRAERDGIVYLKSLGTEVTIVHVLELITRLKQICNADPKTGDSCKIEDIAGRMSEIAARDHKAVVFSQYTSATAGVRLIERRLVEFRPLVLMGDTPVPERSAVIDAFRTRVEHPALIASLGVGGVGLNLQEASYVFHLDRWWNPAVERQAEDRVHRIGQKAKVHVVKYTCADTIEQRIEKILEDKQALFDELIDDVTLDLAARLSREELLGLFGL